VYRLVIYPEAQEQIAALPDDALNGYADVLAQPGRRADAAGLGPCAPRRRPGTRP